MHPGLTTFYLRRLEGARLFYEMNAKAACEKQDKAGVEEFSNMAVLVGGAKDHINLLYIKVQQANVLLEALDKIGNWQPPENLPPGMDAITYFKDMADKALIDYYSDPERLKDGKK